MSADWISHARRTVADSRTAQRPPATPPVWCKLCKVTGASSIAGTSYRYLYTVTEQTVRPSANSYVPTASSNTPTYDALSVSELTNASLTYSYGVVGTNIPGGFSPVAIPTNTFVLCVPHRMTDGTLIMLIVNTQAIDGDCP